ncbi:hypothetical protein NIES2135_53900 [Leptolyngbya boryana NIES-2135]|jgi:hypothetical protein|uniref:Uncharacterized protein n=1 Tax=Leptolyngbya boryana NIES-2135 TaxID=1973484 RepID=A0A1Z4JPD3_LEPBY|nr:MULTISPECIES: hypothetical protein [Leptolyngbya]BAY58517.1 hypothetical protein NIES2135_53900 [Leptolyngbya boryana NIES-2135]MBD2370992.1 hypothetical protein [Leptolyngbya sp. FACHB-161]MBD2377506.1 hypothetical protein [Leptolyngbya sp. FACHB-238]MBD2401915.1 hypothetical protein [Leptolyngbya sp. FACHB-239]MBD2408432.1 hypothetical protein [Leptolyngbya sp. FACHB-402]
MSVTVIKGEFAGQTAEYLGAHESGGVCISVDDVFAILPIDWVEVPAACHKFKTPTKTMRLPIHLEGRLRAAALVWEDCDSQRLGGAGKELSL